ncbi:MAG: hypothetical protein K2X86_02450 [Cytophagaceae bacterium]|nr:hypothetical protein [Cytophagaceae bacterium]
MKNNNHNLKVFIQEDELSLRIKIEESLKDQNYDIYFFSKSESIFDLINFNPDILIRNFQSKEVLYFKEWMGCACLSNLN